MNRLIVFSACAASMGAADNAIAKPEHLERVRVLLMTQKAMCVSCHTAADSPDLNPYGRALADLGNDEPLSERMLSLAKLPRQQRGQEDSAANDPQQDIDKDGIPNWVEVLAGTNPGDKASAPDTETRDKIESIISCKICHVETNAPGQTDQQRNPHNELGKLLAKTNDPAGSRAPRERSARGERGERGPRSGSESTPILKRIKLAAMKPGRSGKAGYWEKLLLLCAPADAAEPPAEDVKQLRRFIRNQKSKKTRDETRGMGPHKPDGFLKDAL
ncbi:MAG: hypothetical protein HUU22_01825 [Phycisphaerae bacterium]|nr:hypothetical protein [Phycisphaerae bacterium]NUQ44752.1 hypothetical protein [Phycisphaerae bacterium]